MSGTVGRRGDTKEGRRGGKEEGREEQNGKVVCKIWKEPDGWEERIE